MEIVQFLSSTYMCVTFFTLTKWNLFVYFFLVEYTKYLINVTSVYLRFRTNIGATRVGVLSNLIQFPSQCQITKNCYGITGPSQ